MGIYMINLYTSIMTFWILEGDSLIVIKELDLC